jgi:HEAT repeat protein
VVKAVLRILDAASGVGQSSPKSAAQNLHDYDTASSMPECSGFIDHAWRVRVAACEVLEVIAAAGQLSDDASVALASVAGHRYFEVRQSAVAALGRIANPGDSVATNALILALGDDIWNVRDAAVSALCGLAAPRREGSRGCASQLVPAICGRLTDTKADARQSARKALCALTDQAGFSIAKTIVHALIHAAHGRRVPLLRRPSAEVRSAVVQCLGDAIMSLARDDLANVGTALQCKGALEEALRACAGALADKSALVRRAVVSALSISGESGPILPSSIRHQMAALAMATVTRESFDASKEEFLHLLQALAAPGDDAATEVACRALHSQDAPTNVLESDNC